jgi:hypothetical protein
VLQETWPIMLTSSTSALRPKTDLLVSTSANGEEERKSRTIKTSS